MGDYIIPAGYGEAEYIDKKSRFIGQVEHVESESEAMAFVERVRCKHEDATHNVWAYILSGGAMRWSDDGEPGGTSGQPTLNVFRRAGVCDVCCVVTRYFGGILLGSGGLVRAYSKAAALALEAAGRARMAEWERVELMCSYSQYERVRRLLEGSGGGGHRRELRRIRRRRRPAARRRGRGNGAEALGHDRGRGAAGRQGQRLPPAEDGGMNMIFRRAESAEFEEIRNFYWKLIDSFDTAQYGPGWKKGVYPSDVDLKAALGTGELYVLDDGENIAAAAVINRNTGGADGTSLLSGEIFRRSGCSRCTCWEFRRRGSAQEWAASWRESALSSRSTSVRSVCGSTLRRATCLPRSYIFQWVFALQGQELRTMRASAECGLKFSRKFFEN